MYRGREQAPFVHGATFMVVRAWDPGPEWAPCDECIPGFNAPAIELRGVKSSRPDTLLCSCTFRPVYPRRDESGRRLERPAPAPRLTEPA
jgi:hypothetical protein